MNVILNCAAIRTKEDFHAKITQTLQLPAFYGNNLDALHDCLTDMPQKTVINLLHTQALIDNLGAYGRAIINVLSQTERETPAKLTVNLL